MGANAKGAVPNGGGVLSRRGRAWRGPQGARSGAQPKAGLWGVSSPNIGLQPTPYSLRSYLAPASRRG